MRRQKLFEPVLKNINKFETRLDKYVIPPIPDVEEIKGADKKSGDLGSEDFSHDEEDDEFLKTKEKNAERYAAFTPGYVLNEPRLCIWTYMNENEVQSILQITSKREIRKAIDNKMAVEYPKGISRLLVTELVYSVLQFCKKSKFDVTQTGSLLSIFYLTHQYFLSSFYTTPEKIFIFFKDSLLLNCLECPPDSMQLFNYPESNSIAKYFCKVYLTNLPLLRLLTLPNFAFRLDFPIPPPIKIHKKDDKKKDKKKKRKRK